MKKSIILSAMLFASVCSKSFASSSSEYFVDDAAIETTLNEGVEVNYLTPVSNAEVSAQNNMLAASASMPASSVAASKDPVVAFILSTFLGGLGIHRFYMGTATLTGVGYILTLGGCGIVAFVDWVVLLIALVQDEGIGKYTDNPKFFMWGGR
ncbi:TM2 domain-containing protein [Flectobacillus sp. DC10W]|uniref:TM2 domain-containing protein n=1 Tax=Flectobacillus longus TaxID=2984207 RepID=A0ABT6YU01_9BACT|nr:TM2 domain-containing protein [Flectobacillus longus]MDI9867079.1 TM2 domain-containing protein [Flectobacillus longus]